MRQLSVQEIADAAGCSYHTVRAWLRRHGLQFEPRGALVSPATPRGIPGSPATDSIAGGARSRKTRFGPRDRASEATSGAAASPRSERPSAGGRPSRRRRFTCNTTTHARCRIAASAAGRLHAHHIVPVWLDPALARDIGNLVTVCDECHRRIHRTLRERARSHSRQLGRTAAVRKTSATSRPERG